MKSKDQFGSLAESYKTLSQTFGYFWAFAMFIGVGAFIFSFYQVALNCLYTLIASFILSCLFGRLYVKQLAKNPVNDADNEASDTSDKYKEYLSKSQKALEEAKAKQEIRKNLTDRSN